MSMSQKSMSESELNLRQFARNRVRKRKARRLPVVEGYSTSIRKSSGAIVFSNNTDGWCFEYDVNSVKKLALDNELESSLKKKHREAVINRESMNRNGFYNGLATADSYKRSALR
ncbi:hypothetical protein [Psychrobacter sp.]|uniref:hypothetical protein n=1 Tax=Psychrobacter sp. TaxID=56811 RepID=UPI003565B69E